MAARWRLLDAVGTERSMSDVFADADEAESWLASTWGGLREDGIAIVALIVDGEEHYRMSLADDPADGAADGDVAG